MRKMSQLQDWQGQRFAPYLRGTVAEIHLRIAALSAVGDVTTSADKQTKAVNESVRQLEMSIAQDRSEVAHWSMLRLAEIEYSRGRPKEALRWIATFADDASLLEKPFFF